MKGVMPERIKWSGGKITWVVESEPEKMDRGGRVRKGERVRQGEV